MVHPFLCLSTYGFRYYFTERSALLFTFPSRYQFTIGPKVYLALRRGRRRFTQDFTCLELLGNPLPPTSVSITGLSPSLATLSRVFFYCYWIRYCGPATPKDCSLGLGSSLFARRYLGNHLCFLFLRLLRCFSWARTLLLHMYFVKDLQNVGVNLFGNLWIKAFQQLPKAYRNYIRPSSVLSAKASAACINVEYF